MNIFPDFFTVYLDDDPRVMQVPIERVHEIFVVGEQIKMDWSKPKSFEESHIIAKRYKLEIVDALTCIGRRIG